MFESQHVCMRASVVICLSSRRLSFVLPRLNPISSAHAVSSRFIRSGILAGTTGGYLPVCVG